MNSINDVLLYKNLNILIGKKNDQVLGYGLEFDSILIDNALPFIRNSFNYEINLIY